MNIKSSIWKGNTRRFHSAASGDPLVFSRGFTIIEVMIVITIIGILAIIALPNFLSYRKSGYDAMAQSDAKNSSDAARAYFNDFPHKIFSGVAGLDHYGFKNSEGVTLTITGNADTLMISASHSNGSKTFTVDAGGKLGF